MRRWVQRETHRSPCCRASGGRLKVICLLSVSFALIVNQDCLKAKPASIEHIRQLFRLATVTEPRIWVKADIDLSDEMWEPDQIAAEQSYQNQIMKDDDKDTGPNAGLNIASSNAIARSHSGKRLLHVQEWYSGHGYYRLDQTVSLRENHPPSCG